MTTEHFLEDYDDCEVEVSGRRNVAERIPQRSYSPRHIRQRAKTANLRSGAHRRRVKRYDP